MIGVLTFLRAKPDRLTDLTDALQDVIAASLRVQGCLVMHLHADPLDPCKLMIYEQWVSKTDLDIGGALPQFQRFWQQRLEYLEDEIDIRFFELVVPAPMMRTAHG